MKTYNILLDDELIISALEHKRAMIKHCSDPYRALELENDPIEFFIADYIFKFVELHANSED